MTVDAITYRLDRIELHTPSEHSTTGRPAAAEAQFVHQSIDGGLAVVAVLVEVGAESATLGALLELLPRPGQQTTTAAPVDLDAMLPARRSAVRYEGSLTTPPCTEGVKWLVLVDPVQLSLQQLVALQAQYADNARPLQDAHDRAVLQDID